MSMVFVNMCVRIVEVLGYVFATKGRITVKTVAVVNCASIL